MHTSPFLLVSMASSEPEMRDRMEQLAGVLSAAGVSSRVSDSEAQVMWSKLVRLNALACTTSAYDKLLGEIRDTPELRRDLVGAMEEASAVAQAEGAPDVDAARAIKELDAAHETLGSSMQRDIAAGRLPELDAIPGSVLRAAARHGIPCPTIQRLVGLIAERAGIDPPARRLIACASALVGAGRTGRRDHRQRLRGDRLDRLLLGLGELLIVLSVAEHPEVARHAAVGLDRDSGQDLLALVEAEPLHVEVGQADPMGRVSRVLPVVGGNGLREALQVLGDLARVAHRSLRGG